MTGADHGARLDGLVQSVLTAPGDSDVESRRTALEIGERLLSGDENAADALPPAARTLAWKVALHPYKVIDEDLDELRRAGWSDNGIFELVVGVAVGAGRAIAASGMRLVEP